MVAWSRSAAARSAALANWVSDTGGAKGAFATLVPAAALRTLSRVAEGGAEDGGALEGCSLAQLAQLLHGAHFLDVDVELLRRISAASRVPCAVATSPARVAQSSGGCWAS